MAREITREDVLKANVEIHTSLIDIYNDEPHFRPENLRKVSAILAGLRERVAPTVQGKARMLDMGCGTGFLLGLAEPLFDELHGVDITPSMLEKIDLSSGKITLHQVQAEQTPFEDASFDLVTAYSFMDHLYDLRPFLAEVFRVLKPGGVFYGDQNANRAFWRAVGALPGDPAAYPPLVRREMTAGLRVEEEYAKTRDIDTEAFRVAEYIKSQQDGIDADEVLAIAREIGFRDAVARYDWFLGQGNVLHGQGPAAAELVEAHLREVAPLGNHLFKYLRFDLTK